MADLIWEKKEVVARKDHACMACEWLLNDGLGNIEFSISEYRQIVKARRNGWKIKKGQKYLHQVCKHDGEIVDFRAIPEINELCWKHEIYQD